MNDQTSHRQKIAEDTVAEARTRYATEVKTDGAEEAGRRYTATICWAFLARFKK